MVASEVLISGPDDREGNEEVDEVRAAVQQFWKKMMAKHGSEETIQQEPHQWLKHGDDPEIIIVVRQAAYRFDAPRNTVLYLTRQLKDHTLLQRSPASIDSIDGKDFGYIIDYRGVLQNLNNLVLLCLYMKYGKD